MAKLFVVLITPALLFSCGQDKPKINYNSAIDTTSVMVSGFKDTTKIMVSELPIRFDSTEILLFPIGLVDLQDRGGYSKIGSGAYSDYDIAASYFDSDKLMGNFINIVFQDKNGSERKLTDMRIHINHVVFLREVFKNTNSGYLLYSTYDRDSNGDKILNHTDLEALYISKIDGSGFKKLTKELHEFYDWGLVKGENKIYYRTLEDKNKDGELNNNDKFHYYSINFYNDHYEVDEYNPLKIFK